MVGDHQAEGALRDSEIRQARHSVATDEKILRRHIPVQDAERPALAVGGLVRGVQPCECVEHDGENDPRGDPLASRSGCVDEALE